MSIIVVNSSPGGLTRGGIKRLVLDALAEENTRQMAEQFWSDSDLNDYFDAALETMCRETEALDKEFLTTTVNGQLSYPLDNSIVDVNRVKPAGASVLTKLTTAKLDRLIPGWQHSTGTPKAWVDDYQQGYLTFDRIPTTAISMTVNASYVASKLTDDDQEPDFPAIHRRQLIFYMLAMACNKVGAPPSVKEKVPVYAALHRGAVNEIRKLAGKTVMSEARPTIPAQQQG